MRVPIIQRGFAIVILLHPPSPIVGGLILGVVLLGPAVDFEEAGT